MEFLLFFLLRNNLGFSKKKGKKRTHTQREGAGEEVVRKKKT
jgi:hypothetical protein